MNTGITSGLVYATAVGATAGGAAIIVPVAAAAGGTILGEMNNQGWDALLGDGEDPQLEEQAIYDADSFHDAGLAQINGLAARYDELAARNGVDPGGRQNIYTLFEEAYEVQAR